MTIETKFNIGDTFFAMKDNLIQKLKVESVQWDSSIGVTYTSTEDCSYEDREYEERKCFPTKEELLKSL